MSFADLLEKQKPRPATKTLDRILASLDEGMRAGVLEAIRNPEIGPTAIARGLYELAPQFATRGVPYSENIVRAHPEYRFGDE